MGKICDISKYQGSIDWAVASKELDMAIIRVQYGSKVEDEFHVQDEIDAKENGVPFGEYAFGHFVSVDDAKVEANDFLKRISPDAKFLVLDVEQPTIDVCGTDKIAEATQAFIDVCKAAGHKIGLYVSHNLYKSYGLDGVKSDFLWIPRYGKNDGTPSVKPDYPCDLWQFTSVGKLDGIQGDVDLSQLNGDKDLAWFIGEPPAPQPKKESIVKKVVKAVEHIIHHDTHYSVAPNDTLSGIAAKFNVSVDDLVKWNNIRDKDLIRVGQMITIKKANHHAVNHTEKKTYTVQKGDSLSKISSDHGLSLTEIEKLNPQIKDYDVISIGERINLN